MIKALTVSTALLLGLIVAGPLAVCAAYSLGTFGSVAPWVPSWSVATLLCAPFAVYLPLASHLTGTGRRILLGAAAIVLAFPAAILAANVFMALSQAFGLYDYHQM